MTLARNRENEVYNRKHYWLVLNAPIVAGVNAPIDNMAVSDYNNIWGFELNYNLGAVPGTNDIHQEPLFVDTIDYRLKSTAGHYDPNGTFVSDGVTSPCIDAGDPADSIGQEQNPNGGRINMGFYGGTSEASLSTGDPGPPPKNCTDKPTMDANDDCIVDILDFATFSLQWLSCGYDIPSACTE